MKATLKQIIAILLLSALASVGFAGSSISKARPLSLADVDVTREWLGREYADAILSDYYRSRKTPLVIELDQIEGFATNETLFAVKRKHVSRAFKAAGKLNFTEVGEAFKSSLSHPVQDFLLSLEMGESIAISSDPEGETQSKLREWVLSQPDNSIYPHTLMTKALALNRGKVLAAWAMTWNVFSENWGAAATRNYGALTAKMISMTGERHLWNGGARFAIKPGAVFDDSNYNPMTADERTSALKENPEVQFTVSKRGDEFSYLYHRIGVELFSMVVSKMSHSSLLGKLIAKIAALGEYRKYKFTAGLNVENRKRLANDLAAAESGSRFYQLIQSGTRVVKGFDFSEVRYFRSNEKRYNTDYQLPKGVPTHYFGSQSSDRYFGGPMTIDELNRVFEYAVRFDAAILEPVLIDSNGDLERLQLGLKNYMESGLTDVSLNTSLQAWAQGVRAGSLPTPLHDDVEFDHELNAGQTQGIRTPEDYEEISRRILRSVDRTLSVFVQPRQMSCESIF